MGSWTERYDRNKKEDISFSFYFLLNNMIIFHHRNMLLFKLNSNNKLANKI